MDWATAEVLRAFDSAGVQSLLLKGASIARWLYDNSNPRSYSDCDLLVRPADHDTAQRVLAELGYEPTHDEAEMPTWWRDHGVAWLRNDDAVAVDLHRTLEGIPADPQDLWDTLEHDAVPLEVGGFDAQALSIPGRAFTVAIHAAQHGTGWHAVQDELELAITRVDIATWRAAAEIAGALGSEAVFAAGLRLAPSGPALAGELGLAFEEPVDVTLRASTPPAVALGFAQLAQARNLGQRLAILWHKFFPPATFMRKWSPRAAEGRIGLVRAYLWRPFWLLSKAPAGFNAWRRARRRRPR